MMKTKQTKMYEAPKTELIEISPLAVLCESAVDAGLFQFNVGTAGQWDGGVVAP